MISVTDTMMDVNNSITMPALSTIVLDLRETNWFGEKGGTVS